MPPKLSSDKIATIAGGSAGLLLIYQVDWGAISRGRDGSRGDALYGRVFSRSWGTWPTSTEA